MKSRIPLTYEIARATGKDVANQQMRKQGRTEWNLDDWNLACATFDRLKPYIVGWEPQSVKEEGES